MGSQAVGVTIKVAGWAPDEPEARVTAHDWGKQIAYLVEQ